LAKTTFTVPNAMLYAQLANPSDIVGRLLAIEQLANKQDKEAVAKLKQALNHDAFYGVRLEASKALRTIHSDEAFDALLASTNQPDARVRYQVVNDLGGFYRDAAYELARLTLEGEKNPDIQATALRELSSYAKPAVHEVLVNFLNSDSFRNELAGAAIGAMRSQDDPAYIAPLLETLPRREADFTSRDFGQALSALAYLSRNEDKKDKVREFLTGYVNHKKRTVRVASITALGTLGDSKAITVLETFARAGKETRERAAAEKAVADLRAGRKPVDDFKNLRGEVLDLQKQNRELKKQVETIEKKLETLTTKPAAAPKKSSSGKSPKETMH
jgi:aminopeptidase N